jgi:heme A synthase
MPHPGGAVWWWTRPLFFVLVLAAVLTLSLPLMRFEKTPTLQEARFTGATPLAILLFVLPVLGITTYGLDLPLALAALVGTVAALWLTGAFAAPRDQGAMERA